MQTLYIDVYFLVNFVVDTVSLFFGMRLGRGEERVGRCIIGGALAALVAVVCVLVSMPAALFFLFFFGSLLAICAFVSIGCGKKVYFRLVFWFLLLESVIGGVVYALYIQLDSLLKNMDITTNNGAENRVFLYLSVAALFGVGAVRLLSLLFCSGRQIRTMELDCTILGMPMTVRCLYDTGNFLVDPVSAYPVVLVKARALKGVLCEDFLCEQYDRLSEQYRRLLRLIPVHGVSGVRILTGLTVRDAVLTDRDLRCKRAIVVAVDKEEGDFGGYDGLLPGAVLNI